VGELLRLEESALLKHVRGTIEGIEDERQDGLPLEWHCACVAMMKVSEARRVQIDHRVRTLRFSHKRRFILGGAEGGGAIGVGIVTTGGYVLALET
jgi:hypothetical protein